MLPIQFSKPLLFIIIIVIVLLQKSVILLSAVGKADLLSDHFGSRESREAVDLPLTCHPSPSLIIFAAFRSREVRRLLLDLDPYGSTDPLGMFPLFLKRTDVMAPLLSVVFRRLV